MCQTSSRAISMWRRCGPLRGNLNTSWERWGKEREGKKYFGIGGYTAVFGREIKFFFLHVIPFTACRAVQCTRECKCNALIGYTLGSQYGITDQGRFSPCRSYFWITFSPPRDFCKSSLRYMITLNFKFLCCPQCVWALEARERLELACLSDPEERGRPNSIL
jgi:hypothetical protein